MKCELIYIAKLIYYHKINYIINIGIRHNVGICKWNKTNKPIAENAF